MATPEAAYVEVERLVKKFKALPTAQRRAYNEDNTRDDLAERRQHDEIVALVAEMLQLQKATSRPSATLRIGATRSSGALTSWTPRSIGECMRCMG